MYVKGFFYYLKPSSIKDRPDTLPHTFCSLKIKIKIYTFRRKLLNSKTSKKRNSKKQIKETKNKEENTARQSLTKELTSCIRSTLKLLLIDPMGKPYLRSWNH